MSEQQAAGDKNTVDSTEYPQPQQNTTNKSESIDATSQRAFDSIANYLQSELEASASDLNLLEKLNDASINKYEGLSRQAQDMLVHAYKIKQTYNEMQPHIAEEALEAIFKKCWEKPNTAIRPDALELSAEFLMLFAKEAIDRAKARRTKSGGEEMQEVIDESDLEKILAQLMLDF
ncbi:hypothetical protein H4S08_001995 [Coemansia sp. RSA 1365]|nr:hypothetical protein H4S08_001995 [Coemansia sp. RSA 1365]